MIEFQQVLAEYELFKNGGDKGVGVEFSGELASMDEF